MKRGCCPNNCKYLSKDFGCCTHPDLNGHGKILKKNEDGNYIRICTKIPVNKVPLDNKYCNHKCAYLEKDYGFCLNPRLHKSGVKLKKDNLSYLRICNQFPTTTCQKSKFNAKKITVDGVTFDSKLEYERFCELTLLQKAGKIENLRHHVKFPLIEKSENGREIAYEADFVYEENGETVVEDTKSEPTKTRLYSLKKRLLLEKYGIKIKEIMKGDV